MQDVGLQSENGVCGCCDREECVLAYVGWGGGVMCHDESCRQRVRASLAGLDLCVLIDGYISSVAILAHVPT